MTKNKIPVVFSADANYGYPMIFSVLSMIRHAKEDTRYEFILLVSHDFPQKYKDVIDRHAKEADMLVRYIDMQDAFEDVNMHIKHITQATYYRSVPQYQHPDTGICLYRAKVPAVSKQQGIIIRRKRNSVTWIVLRCRFLTNISMPECF